MSCLTDWVDFVSFLPPAVLWRWSEPSSSSQSTECSRYAAWRRSMACPTIIEIDSWRRRGAARSASASTSSTGTRTTARTPCWRPLTAWTTAWAGAASSGGHKAIHTEAPISQWLEEWGVHLWDQINQITRYMYSKGSHSGMTSVSSPHTLKDLHWLFTSTAALKL